MWFQKSWYHTLIWIFSQELFGCCHNFCFWFETSTEKSWWTKQDISQEGKKFCILHELGNKMQLGVWAHWEPLNWLNGLPLGKALEKFALFSLKLVWYSLFKIVKLKLSVSNKKLLFWFKIGTIRCMVFFVFLRSRVKQK